MSGCPQERKSNAKPFTVQGLRLLSVDPRTAVNVDEVLFAVEKADGIFIEDEIPFVRDCRLFLLHSLGAKEHVCGLLEEAGPDVRLRANTSVGLHSVERVAVGLHLQLSLRRLTGYKPSKPAKGDHFLGMRIVEIVVLPCVVEIQLRWIPAEHLWEDTGQGEEQEYCHSGRQRKRPAVAQPLEQRNRAEGDKGAHDDQRLLK